MLITTCVIVLVVYVIVNMVFSKSSIWRPFSSCLTMAILLVLIVPVAIFTNILFLVLVQVIVRLTEAGMSLMKMLSIGEEPDYEKHEIQRREYLIEQKLQAIKQPFEAPSFDRCLAAFKNNN